MSGENVQISRKKKIHWTKIRKNGVFMINSHVDENKPIIKKSKEICDNFAFEKSNYISIIMMLNDEIEINIVNQKFIVINNILASQKFLSKSHWINEKKIHYFETHDFILYFENNCKKIRVFTTTFYAMNKKESDVILKLFDLK